MLILAGVSINAIVGENGILTRTQYATFLSEMSAVEEAVQMWKAGEMIDSQGNNSTAIPTNGMCKTNDLTSTVRLVGEIGYYRVWSISETMPATNILSSASDFNSSFESEFVSYPAGVQDLYYLNNEACGIDSNKTYLIDAVTGMIYSMTGISLKGVSCYSSNMAKAVMSGDMNMPQFASAEVSGAGNNIIYAGSKYLVNKEGQYVDENGNIVDEANKVENPNGFQIIASPSSNNIYKLYNNGDLYAKGVKGPQINTIKSEMDSIDNLKWSEFTVPAEIGSYKEVIQGANTMYVIDSSDYLWAWGDNSNNKLGLTITEQQEYTGREAVKLNVAGKKVSRVFGLSSQTYVITTDNCLYSVGLNGNYQLGLGHNNEVSTFTEVDFEDVGNISSVFQTTDSRNGIIIETKDNKYYAVSSNAGQLLGKKVTLIYKKYAPIWDGYIYTFDESSGKYIINSTIEYDNTIDFASRIKKVVSTSYAGFLFLFDDECVYHIGSTKYIINNVNTYEGLTQFSTTFSTDVKDIYGAGQGMLVLRKNGEVWACNSAANNVGLEGTTYVATQVVLPEELENSGIKEIFATSSAVYYLSNDNELFASTSEGAYVGMESQPAGIVKVDSPKFKTLYPKTNNIVEQYSGRTSILNLTVLFEGNDNKVYSINNEKILFRDNILQKNYTKIASNVDSIALGSSSSIAYIEKATNEIYVAGNDSRMLGLGSSTQIKISNFTKITDAKVAGKAKEIQFSRGVMYVLTNTGTLFATGICGDHNESSLWNYNFPGWSEIEDRYEFVEVLENVDCFYADYSNIKIALSNNVIFTWGHNYYGNLPKTSYVPTAWDVSSEIDLNNVKKLCANYSLLQILLNDGSLFIRSNSSSDDTGAIARYKDKNLHNVTAEYDGEQIIDVMTLGRNAAYQVMLSGNVYGWGSERYLGIGSSSAKAVDNTTKLNLKDVIQMTTGNGFAVAVTKDGKVYATGSNTYGIFGRWIGIDRNSPNSRYKTAFEWVECPELEI